MGAAELGSHMMEKTLAASLLGSLTDGVPVLVGLKFQFLWLSMQASQLLPGNCISSPVAPPSYISSGALSPSALNLTYATSLRKPCF